MNINDAALKLHKENQGKIEVRSKIPLTDASDLSLAYTPGVAVPCIEIFNNPESVFDYTAKGRLVAVVSDGSAVLGLGNIGSKAAIPVMEGKSLLFKKFADVDAVPICLDTQDSEQIVNVVKLISPVFGGINLEDIAAPKCFEVEQRLIRELDIPVFHDDQHGTAIVVLSGVINALKIVNKELTAVKIVISGAGAAGIAIANILLIAGANDIILCDRLGTISRNRDYKFDYKREIATRTNKNNIDGCISDALVDADIVIGVSGPGSITKDMIKVMASDPIVFALANPTPEIFPEEALEAGARIVGTGRSDYPNQLNNILVFPGLFRGVLEIGASKIDDAMKINAAYAIAGVIKDSELTEEYCIPSIFDKRVTAEVTYSVAKTAIDNGTAKKNINLDSLRKHILVCNEIFVRLNK